MNPLVAFSLISIGLFALVASLAIYISRTGDKGALTRTWAKREELTRTEYILNRGGFALTIVGFALLAGLIYSGR